MWAFHLRLFEIVTPRSFTLVSTCIGLLLIVTALKEYADLAKLTCNSLHLVSFNWNLFVPACLTSLSTASYFHLVGPCGLSRPWMCHQHTSKVDVIDIDVIYHDQEEPGPQFGPLRYTCPDWSPIRVAIMGELHSLLPDSEKVPNPVQHPRWELIIASLAIRMAWSIRSNAFLKPKSITCTVEPLPSTVHQTVLLSFLSFR